MENKRSGSSKFDELKRYLMGYAVFCLCVAMAGMAANGYRVFSIAWWSLALLVILWAMTRIIIWAWSSSEQVKKGAYEHKKGSE